MLKSYLTAFCVLISIAGNSQYLTNANYEINFGDLGNGTFNDHLPAKSLLDGDYLYHVTYKVGTANHLLVKKHHVDGTATWEATIGDIGPITTYHGLDIKVDGSDNVYVIGAKETTAEGYNAILVKYNSSGVKQWDYEYHSSGSNDEFVVALEVDGSGNCYMAGQVDNGTSTDALIVSTNASGNFAWANTYDEDGQDDGAILVTYVNSTTIEMIALTEDDAFGKELTKIVYNSSGVEQSDDRSNLGFTDAMLSDLQRLSSGDYVICGWKPDAINNDKDLAVYKLSSAMATTWSYIYDESGHDDWASSLIVDGSGNVFVTGVVEIAVDQFSTVSLELNNSGTLQWKENFKYLVHYNTAGHKGAVYDDHYISLGTKLEDNGDVVNFLNMRSTSDGSLEWYWEDDNEETINPYFLEIGPNDEMLFGAIESDGLTIDDHVTSLEVYERNFDFITETETGAEYVDDQLILSFTSASVLTSTIDNTDILFGSVDDFLTPSTISSLETYFGTSIDFDLVTVSKIFRKLTTNSTTSISRQGRSKDIPKFWTTLLFDFNASVNELALIDDFDHENLDEIAYSSVNYKLDTRWIPNDTEYDEQECMFASNTIDAHIHAEAAWEIEDGQEFVRIAIVDQDVDWSHEDFQISTGGRFEDSKIAGGWSWTHGKSIGSITSNEADFHGTTAAGISAALKNNNTGIAGMAGGNMAAGVNNPGATLFGLGIPNPVVLSDAADAMVEAAKNDPNDTKNPGYRAHIINVSWGKDKITKVKKAPLMTNAFKFAKNQGVVVVAAASNLNNDVASLPDSYNDDWLIKVSASNNDDQRAFTAFGHNLDVLAPGSANMHTYLLPGNGYSTNRGGTSWAAPLVSGTAALMMSNYNFETDDSRNLFPEDVEWIIEQSAEDLEYKDNDDNDLAINGYDDESGWGKLRADWALSMLSTPNFKIKHVFNQTNTESKIESEVFVELTDWYYESGKDKILKNGAKYKVDVYEVEVDVSVPWPTWHAGTYEILDENHGLTTDTLFEIFEDAFWALNSSSNLWFFDEANETLSPYNDLRFKVAPHKNTAGTKLEATVIGHIFFVIRRKNSLKKIEKWLPHKNTDAHNLDFSVMFTLEWGLGQEEQLANGINLFPNPASSQFTIQNSGDHAITDIEVYDMLGRRSLQINHLAPAQSTSVSTKGLRPGVYVVKYRQQTEMQTRKLHIR